ncbi:MAG TPA: hypothetical protein VFQ53_38675 [Kofleriaceae bacterium]|nr:hypothetical protein [Kofleriaceae bacterium]
MNRFLLITLALAGCTDTRDAITGTQSLEVTLVAPADPCPVSGLADTERTITVNIRAKDAQNQLDTTFTKDVQVYAQFLGTLTPSFGDVPLATFTVTNGVADNQSVTLPNAFGRTTLWIDDGEGVGPDYVHGSVTGTSPILCYRDPFISDLQKPRDETALDALSSTPLQDKQIGVHTSRYGDTGFLVVTSVFAQGYTVSDVQCADTNASPPCTYQAYDHAMVFTFSAPRLDGRSIEVGEVIGGFAGGLSEFNGLTEIGFPQTFAPVDKAGQPVSFSVDPARIPAPAVLTADWFKSLTDPSGGMINFERNEAAPIEIDNAKVCDLDDDFATFKQWKLDPAGVGGNCAGNRNVLNVITNGISEIDPPSLVGQTLPKVVGVLRPVNIGSFNVWIIFPRDANDVTLP